MLLVFSVSGQKGNHFFTFLWMALTKNYIQMSSGGSILPYYEIAINYSWMLMPLCCSGWTLCNLKSTPATSCCGDYLCSWYDQLAFAWSRLCITCRTCFGGCQAQLFISIHQLRILAFFRKTSPEDCSVCNLVSTMSSGSSEHSMSWAELWLQICQQRWGIRCNILSFLITFLPTTGLLLVLVHNATSCYITYLGYFSGCFLWVCVFVIKTSSASWLHPRSVLFLSLSLLIPKLVLLFQF